VADARFRVTGVSVGSGPADVVGRAVVVHADPDDYRTQPTGNAGSRIACGVIVAHP
jgi:Cu-Zn family superoxide dismutase